MRCIGVGGLGYRKVHMKDANAQQKNPFSVRNDRLFTTTPCTWTSVPLSPFVVQATKGP